MAEKKEKKTTLALLDREDVAALLSHYLLEVKSMTEQMPVEESWQTANGKEVMRLLKKCADLTEKMEELAAPPHPYSNVANKE